MNDNEKDELYTYEEIHIAFWVGCITGMGITGVFALLLYWVAG